MGSRKNKATLALGLSALIFIIIYPYHNSFWGGLLSSACLAALIGGLADWFAVTALFRKPLGIAYKTEVIPRNRERLFNEIIHFTADDLLNVEHISNIVRRYDMATLLIAFLNESNGKEKVKKVVHIFIEKLFMNFDFRIVAEKVAELLQQSADKVNFAGICKDVFSIIRQNKYDQKVIATILGKAVEFVRDEKVSRMLADLIDRMKTEYEGDLARRQLMSFVMDLSSHKLAVIAQEEVLKHLVALQDPMHPQRLRLEAWLKAKVEDPEVMEQLEAWKNNFLADKWLVAEKIEKYLENHYRGEQAEKTIGMIMHYFDKITEEKFSELENDVGLQVYADTKIKEILITMIKDHHQVVVGLVEARLRDFSDDELVGFIEDRVADDLQMIRINGSLVGSLVGILLYLVTYAAERMWL